MEGACFMKVGIPKALLYYYDGAMWKYFFEKLNVEMIVSEETNKQTIKDGEALADSEACLSIKIFLGQVKSLEGKCDCILVPRLYSIKKLEQVCTNFNCLYDLTHNLFPKMKILHYNIDLYEKKNEVLAYTKLGEALGFSYIRSYNAYCYAKRKKDFYYKNKIEEQKMRLKSKKLKILFAGHPYNLYDEIVGQDIIEYLRKEGIEIIYSNLLEDSLVDFECSKISTDIHWTHSKKVVAAVHYYQDKVDGIILLSTFPCGPDSLSNEIIKRKVTTPILTINKESFSNTGLYTRLDAFFDILKVKYEKCH